MTFDETRDRKMKALELTEKIINACAEAKGRDISVLDMSAVFALTDYFVVVSGRSDRQVQGISNKILTLLEEDGIVPIAREGMEEGQWVLLDYGDVVVHVFYEAAREHYDIERLWARAHKLTVTENEHGFVLRRAA